MLVKMGKNQSVWHRRSITVDGGRTDLSTDMPCALEEAAQKPNSRTYMYNFVKVSVNNLESSQT